MQSEIHHVNVTYPTNCIQSMVGCPSDAKYHHARENGSCDKSYKPEHREELCCWDDQRHRASMKLLASGLHLTMPTKYRRRNTFATDAGKRHPCKLVGVPNSAMLHRGIEEMNWACVNVANPDRIHPRNALGMLQHRGFS